MSAAKLDPALCRRLAAECTEDDVRMTPAPWRKIGSDAQVMGDLLIVCSTATGGDDADDQQHANGDAIARTRNNLPAIASALEAAAEMAERTQRDERIHAQEGLAVESGWVELDHPTRMLTAREAQAIVHQAVEIELVQIGVCPSSMPPGSSKTADAIADRAAKELAGATVASRDDLEMIRRRVTHLTLAVGLPREVWSELCYLDTALSQMLAGAVVGSEIAKLRSALREALSCWRYPQPTAAEKFRKDEIWAMVYPIDERDGIDAAFDRAAVAITGRGAAELTAQLKPAATLDADDLTSLQWAREFIGVHALPDNAAAGRMLGLIDRMLATDKDGPP